MSPSGQTEQLRVRVQVGAEGRANVDTGLPVLDRLLALLAEYSRLRHRRRARAGRLRERRPAGRLRARRGARSELRAPEAQGYGSAVLPVDEALAHVVLEVSDRPVLASNVDLSEARVGGLGTDLVTDFLRRFAEGAGITLHVRLIAGDDAQHVLEAMFKALGVALARSLPLRGKGVAMDKEVVRTEAAPAPFQGAPYSQAIKAGGLVFVSGQVALQPGSPDPVSDGSAAQTEQVFANLRAILEAAGTQPRPRSSRPPSTCRNLGDFQEMNEVYRQVRRRSAARARDDRGLGTAGGLARRDRRDRLSA